MSDQSPHHAMDPITFEVMKNALLNATEEMAYTIRRTAYSTNIKTRADFSCAFFDASFRVVAQSFSQPAHLSSLKSAVPNALREYGAGNLAPGDGIILNDPHRGGSHLNDIALIAPVDSGKNRLGYLANMAHHVDVGGSTPCSLGVNREIYQEGIIIPPTKIMRSGEIDENVLGLVLQNVRAPQETGGDLRAQMGANLVGARRIAELIDRYDVAQVVAFFDELLDYTERWARSEISALPTGEYKASGFRDGNGLDDEPVRIAVTVRIRDGSATLDVTGSAPQQSGPLNATRATTLAAIAVVVKSLIDPRILVNDGLYRCMEVAGPDNTVLTATWPAAVVGAWELAQLTAELTLTAMHEALPGRIPACGKGIICNLGFAGNDPRKKAYYCYMETVGGGNGARPTKDGPDAIQTTIHNTENAPIEEVEINYPIHFARYGLITDSGGAGRFRGGLGIRRDFEFPDCDTTFTVLSDGTRFPPWGLEGGGEGRPARFIRDPEGAAEALPSKSSITVPAGGRVSVQTPGGGGFGRPDERDPGAVVRDVRDRKISPRTARETYGVVYDSGNWTVDKEKTGALRQRIQESETR
ncbi:MAG: hydantoinase B/oxoprolinase family protein [Gemmatimonadetes bacterium]|nr:hydantoinase B/oxoprolinase family protein [Gemmatimonadota bacterium]